MEVLDPGTLDRWSEDADDFWASPGGNGDRMPWSGGTGLGPYAAVVLSQDD